MNYKLPFLKVIAASLYFGWNSKADLLRTIALPTLVLVAIWALAEAFPDQMPVSVILVIILAFGFGFSFFAVACHRLILVESHSRYRPLKGRFGHRELRFLGWTVLIYSMTTILDILFVIMAKDILGEVALNEQGQVVEWVKQIASIPALYVLARVSLIFPAAAIDNSVTLKWAWEKTKGNGWRIFLVVGMFPWLIDGATGLLLRQGATVVEWILIAISVFFGLAIGIIALSFTYREFDKLRMEQSGETAVSERQTRS